MTGRENIRGDRSGCGSGCNMQQNCQTMWNMYEALKALVEARND